jgi:hypothetical protein
MRVVRQGDERREVMLGPGLGEVLMLVLPFAFVATIVGIVMKRRADRLRVQAELKKAILGKFGSTAELRDFLKSEEGQAILNPGGSSPDGGIRERAIRRIGLGIVLVIVGGPLVMLSHYADQPQVFSSNSPPPTEFLSIPPGMGLPSAAVLLIGIGLIVSSVFVLLATRNSGDSRS